MLQQSYISTQPLSLAPVVPVAAPLPFEEVSYSPALLLPLPDLATAIVCDHDFVTACKYGYDGYFEEMYHWNSTHDDLVFVHKSFTSSKVYALIGENLQQEITIPVSDRTTLPWRVGFIFGWLSALAKYQPRQAKHGLAVLVGLVGEIRRLA